MVMSKLIALVTLQKGFQITYTVTTEASVNAKNAGTNFRSRLVIP